MTMLRPSKSEIEAVSALLAEGDETPEALAYRAIQLVESLRYERQTWIQVFELSPGVYMGYGPFATRAAAEKAVARQPMAQVARRGGFVPVLGPNQGELALAKADAEVPERGDFKIVREDAALYRRGWNGKQATRKQFEQLLTT